MVVSPALQRGGKEPTASSQSRRDGVKRGIGHQENIHAIAQPAFLRAAQTPTPMW
jgi:hypothetical protein